LSSRTIPVHIFIPTISTLEEFHDSMVAALLPLGHVHHGVPLQLALLKCDKGDQSPLLGSSELHVCFLIFQDRPCIGCTATRGIQLGFGLSRPHIGCSATSALLAWHTCEPHELWHVCLKCQIYCQNHFFRDNAKNIFSVH
jgi:hypothetical protein